MKIGNITFDSKTANSFGLIVAGAGSFDPALPDMTAYSVPGRNGDIFLDNHRYKNIDVTYPGFIPSAFVSNSQSIRNWILTPKEYKKLEDNFDTTHFRMAIGKSVNFSPVNENKAANVSITFNCKPQRFLTSGAVSYNTLSGVTRTNPTEFKAFPIITLKDPMSVGYIEFVNDDGYYKMTATRAYTGTVTIDCENRLIYSGSNNLNDLFSGDFPEFLPGNTQINWSGMSGIGGLGIEIVPGWWEL